MKLILIFFQLFIVSALSTASELDSAPTSGNRLQLISNGDSLKEFLAIAEGAQKYLFLNFLSFSCDSATEPLVHALEQKSRKGTDVRLIVNNNYAWLNLGCLKRLSQAGISVLRTKTHSSYIVNDKSDLLIGSQSVAWMFFTSSGKNGLDRDQMLLANGPLATDAVRDFLHIWEENRDEDDVNSEIVIRWAQKQMTEEVQFHKRGTAFSENCRFLSQMPDRKKNEIEKNLSSLVLNAQKSILFSGVKVDSKKNALIDLLKGRSQEGVDVRFLGNNLQIGNGELTMELDRLIQDWKNENHWLRATAFSLLRDWDVKRQGKDRIKQYEHLMQDSKIEVAMHPQFVHYKIWNIDDTHFFIGSANLSKDSFEDFYESGVLCNDKVLSQEWSKIQTKDLFVSQSYRGKDSWNLK